MMQEKRIIGESQAEQNAKAARTQAANIAKAMSADVTENERFQVYQEEKRQAALEAQRAAERNAEQIATEYEIRAHEQPMQAYRLGEQNAVEIAEAYEEQVREQTVQAYREGEREAVSIAEQARLNAVDAARWAGVASVAQAKQESNEQATSWLSAIPLIGSALNNVWQVSSLKNIWEENANKSIVLPRLTPKNIATAVLTVALGYTGIQWVNNIASNPHIFDEATRNFEAEFQQLLEIHPRTEENTRPDYLFTNSYEAFSIGFDTVKAAVNSGAGYIDAIWQQNPVVQFNVNTSEYMADKVCSADILGEVWARRCSAIPYFLAGVVENPVDTAVGVVTSLVADPVAGFIKLASYSYENNNPYQLTVDMYQSVQKDGLIEGFGNVILDRINGAGDLLSDPQVQSFGILAILALLPLIAAPMIGISTSTLAVIEGGVLLLPQAADLLSQIDKALQSAPTREEAMQVVTNPQIRRQVATTAVLLGLLFLGGKYELDKVTTFRESLPPSSQVLMLEKSFVEQFRLFNAAEALKVSPEAVDFYLTESARSGSSLAWESLNTGLKFSEIYTQIQSSNAQVAVKKLAFSISVENIWLRRTSCPD
ncbi:MAG: hypothetical protein IPJ47_01775 [Anaerolineales bacterium]|nr:hypothetical protein [Anaerolineales bacterium]